MVRKFGSASLTALLLFVAGARLSAQARMSRIPGEVDDASRLPLVRNVHPLARPQFDRGPAPANLPFERMLLVLKPGAEAQTQLDELLKSQQVKASPQYHKWLTPQQFGQRFGASDADLAKITNWLESHGFTVARVANARNTIEFSGTVAQVQEAFHTQIHQYVVNGKPHWANSTNPEIPAALAPIVAGVSTLHNFAKASQIAGLKRQAVKISATGSPGPAFTGSLGEHALSPADFATIYNLAPLYASSITGVGATIAVVARTNINLSDIQSFQNSFGVPYALPQVVLNGTDPGNLGDGDEAEAVLDTSWAAALAPSATVLLVVSASTNTSDGVDLSEEYIIDNNLADIMTESYGDCEADYTQAEAQFVSALAQQAAAQGITYTVATGDSGAAGCDDPSSETVASGPISVNILASTPYAIAVGGTQFQENGNTSFWSAGNGAAFGSAAMYIPEVAWNESCLAASCGSASAGIWAGGGGASILFPKPSWQAGVAGIPDDGARDVPDVSLSSAGHDFYLLCLDGSCTTKHGQSFFSGVSGTSAATPSFAAIMALVVQQTGARQGQAAPTLYALASQQNVAACNTVSVASGCLFNDTASGNNAVPGETGYGALTASYQAGVGYDLATGLGSVNASNLVLGWQGTGVTTPEIRIGIESPSSQNDSVIGVTTFHGWALADSGSVASIAVSVDSVPYGAAGYGINRPDICQLYTSANCPNVGWSFPVDTTLLPNGTHALSITVTASTGQTYTASSNFIVANWTDTNPMRIGVGVPSTNNPTFSGVAGFRGWALDDLSAVSQIAVTVDGVSYGNATYGGSRPDVCSLFPGRAGCPNVGWTFTLDTAPLADGLHTLALTPSTAGGQSSTVTRSFTVANTPANPITLSIDIPGPRSAPFSGVTNFGGWALAVSAPITQVTATIDGLPYAANLYGGSRPDVCTAHPGRPSCPNVGWNLSIDTTEFVNGLHVLVIKASTGAGQFVVSTQTFTVANAVPATPVLIGLDIPRASYAILLGQVTFSGWALNVSGSTGVVSVSIDGVSYGAASYGTSRPDVCALYPTSPNCPNVGWNILVDTSLLANGVHAVTITASGAQQNTLSGQFTVANWTSSNPMKISIGQPNSQSSLSGLANIGGWAIDSAAAIASVSIAVDNINFGAASYGAPRSDVCAIFVGMLGCPNVGWNAGLDTTLLSDGAHALAVTATTTGGQSSTSTQTFQVANGNTSPVRVSIDVPSPQGTLTGVAAIGGWALDTNGAAIANIAVLVDGIEVGTAIYGAPRSDVCAHFSSAGGCPNVGWNAIIDTTPFANGAHTMQVRAAALDGKQYTKSSTFGIANQP